MTFNRAGAVLIACLSVFVMPWIAAATPLQEADLLSLGDGYVTLDSASGLEWLDLNLTAGLSWQDIASGVGGWSTLGFRHATLGELTGLWTDAGFQGGRDAFYCDAATGESYLNLTSATSVDVWNHYTQYGIFDWTHPSVPDGHTIADMTWFGNSPVDWMMIPGTMHSQLDAANNATVGHYLVRSAVLVPDAGSTAQQLAISLVAMAALMLGSCTRRKWLARARPRRSICALAAGIAPLAFACLLDCATASAEPLPPIADISVGSNGEVRVNGQPFFPLVSWCQSTTRFPLLKTLGFNTFCANFAGNPPASNFCDLARSAGGYAIPFLDAKAKGHPALLAYVQGDEPDLGFRTGQPNKTADQVVSEYQACKLLDSTRPIFLSLTAAFMVGPSWAAQKTPAQKQAYYSVAVQGSDIVAVNVYPVAGWNCPTGLIWVADAVTQLRAYAEPSQPVFEFIETCKGDDWKLDVTPEMTRAEVWMAIIRGATGIAYYTHGGGDPPTVEFGCSPEMCAELQRLNLQITRLAPVILAPPSPRNVSIAFDSGIRGDVMAREHDGYVYVFANNLDMKSRDGNATLHVQDLTQGTVIEVVDEGRYVNASLDAFTDHFPALGVHIYRFATPKRPRPLTDLRREE